MRREGVRGGRRRGGVAGAVGAGPAASEALALLQNIANRILSEEVSTLSHKGCDGQLARRAAGRPGLGGGGQRQPRTAEERPEYPGPAPAPSCLACPDLFRHECSRVYGRSPLEATK